MKTIIVSGVPGTGKTVIAKKLALKFKFKYLDVKSLINRKKIAIYYDKKRKTKVIDIEKLNKNIIEEISLVKDKGIVVDSHLSHNLPKKYVDLCVITKCNLKELSKRLNKRRYGKEKVRENLDSEIFDICYQEAKEAGHKVVVVDTTKKVDLREVIKRIR